MVMPASRWAPRPCAGVAGFPWNQWQLCYGISGNFRVEQVAALGWNRWQDSPGIGGSFGVEYAAGRPRAAAPGYYLLTDCKFSREHPLLSLALVEVQNKGRVWCRQKNVR